MNIRTIVSLGCAVAMAGAVSARAAVSEADAAREIERQPVQVVVKTHDLDLTSRAGSSVMLQRISQAAQQACGASSFSFSDFRWATKRSDCYRDSMGRALVALNAPAVTRLYEEHPALAAD